MLTKQQQDTITLLTKIAIVALILGTLPVLTRGFHQLISLLVCALTGFIAWDKYQNTKQYDWYMIGIAIVFNPFFPILPIWPISVLFNAAAAVILYTQILKPESGKTASHTEEKKSETATVEVKDTTFEEKKEEPTPEHSEPHKENE